MLFSPIASNPADYKRYRASAPFGRAVRAPFFRKSRARAVLSEAADEGEEPGDSRVARERCVRMGRREWEGGENGNGGGSG